MNGIVDIELLTSIEFFHPLDAVALNPAVDLFFVIQGQGNVVSVYSFKSTLIWSQSIPCTEAKWSTDGKKFHSIESLIYRRRFNRIL